MSNKEARVKNIVDNILSDLTGRKGLGNEWEAIDEDIQEEIIAGWCDIVVKGMDGLVIGGRYNWQHQPERLVYLGYNWSSNGYWHQFAKVETPRVVWCEVQDSDLKMIEETDDIEDTPAESEV